MDWAVYKIGVIVPEDRMGGVMDALDGIVRPMYPGYDHVFTWWPVTGCWRPLEGSDPYDGEIGVVSVAPEMRLEFAVLAEDLGPAVDAVRRAHPYEEPAIDVIPMVPWKSVIPSDGR